MAKVKIECSACGATGLYKGFAEPQGTAVVCLNCKGTGAKEIDAAVFGVNIFLAVGGVDKIVVRDGDCPIRDEVFWAIGFERAGKVTIRADVRHFVNDFDAIAEARQCGVADRDIWRHLRDHLAGRVGGDVADHGIIPLWTSVRRSRTSSWCPLPTLNVS